MISAPIIDYPLRGDTGLLAVILTGNTEDHFSSDKTGKVGNRVTSTVSDEKTKSEDKEESTGDDEPFQSAHFTDNETQADTDDDGSEGVDILYSSSRDDVSAVMGK